MPSNPPIHRVIYPCFLRVAVRHPPEEVNSLSMRWDDITRKHWHLAGQQLKRSVWKNRRVWLTALGTTGVVLGIRFLGLLRMAELSAYDQLMRLRPVEPMDDRVVIVTIDDSDINTFERWPIADEHMAALIDLVASQEPRAIGLDIYRDLPVEPGHEQLLTVFGETPNLIGIEKLPDAYSIGVQPPPILMAQSQVGFNNIVTDGDGRVRRSLLYWWLEDSEGERQFRTSFALRLAKMYLAEEGITPQGSPEGYLQLGPAVFRPLQPNDGGYIRANTGGYQVMVNFRAPQAGFTKISLTTVLAGGADPDLFRDRVVLIGSTANSLQDFVLTPHSTSSSSAPRMAGVELHAHFISQILSAALTDRPLIVPWSEAMEGLWILSWALFGSTAAWVLRSPTRSVVIIAVATAGLTGVCYVALISGWWVPWVPPVLALMGSAAAITSYFAHLEGELQKSKEFLNSIINTIPDPIFVKDNRHRWIVLNQAYASFVGQPIEDLLEKSEQDVLSQAQADVFRQQDEQTLRTGIANETEEEFTNLHGQTYYIATKRSLHRDAAGNTFLVGVIHDVTQRKRIEEELRRTAAELVQSNAELRQAGDSLRRMAYHDTLTGLPNRKLLEERMIEALDIARLNERFTAVLFLDLDGFKTINDTYGHRLGDLLLKAVASRLTGCLRGSDTVARLGGDEFVVLLPAIPARLNVETVADKIIRNLSQPFALEGISLQVTTSLGVGMYPTDSETPDDLLIKADAAMYQAKEAGKNRYAFFQDHRHLLNGAPKLRSLDVSSDID
jgi:diguanylate cyclase (GGDEF)-like protein/PAS domain S-box-containing protein